MFEYSGNAEHGAVARALAAWTAAGWLRPLDEAFGRFLWSEAPEASPWLILAATLASHQLGRGHVCLDLAATLEDPARALSLPPEGTAPAEGAALPPPAPREVFQGLDLATWRAALEHPLLTGSGAGSTPLVAVGNRLYPRRFWAYEQQVLEQIRRRLEPAAEVAYPLDPGAMRPLLAGLFPDGQNPLDEQKRACALAVRSRFSLITGGPGTGKTTTVLKVLALLQSLALSAAGARPLRIQLAAPTGKAAARLSQSIASRVASLDLARLTQAEAVRAAIPSAVTTLHRLLGSRPDTRHFRHDHRRPLRLDVLVIDEASMIDLEMMAAVLRALPPDARLILLGDKDQLASVEAGAVLGELCRHAEQERYTSATRRWLQEACGGSLPAGSRDKEGTPLDQAVAMLRESHRFPADSGIGRLARAVNAGDAEAALDVLKQSFRDLACLTLGDKEEAAFAALVLDGGPADGRVDATGDGLQPRVGYRHYLNLLQPGRRPDPEAAAEDWDAWAGQVLQAREQFQLLCAVRQGLWGVEGLNPRIESLLARQGLIERSGDWYEGRPVLVTRNDYALGLMNGDMGVTLAIPDPDREQAVLRVAFPSYDARRPIQWVTPTRLEAVETVFALTVHKSQGSEFTHTALVLPNRPNPILTRELIYTGITRASQWFTLADSGRLGHLPGFLRRRVLRSSGLGDALAAP